MNCIKTLREIAMVETNIDRKYLFQGAASVLQNAVVALCADATTANMIELNGAWAYAKRVLELATPPGSTPPHAAAVRAA